MSKLYIIATYIMRGFYMFTIHINTNDVIRKDRIYPILNLIIKHKYN